MDMVEQIRGMIASISRIPAERISLDADLYMDIGVVSVHALQLLSELENKFGIVVPDDEFVEARSVQALAELISRLTGEQKTISAETPRA